MELYKNQSFFENQSIIISLLDMINLVMNIMINHDLIEILDMNRTDRCELFIISAAILTLINKLLLGPNVEG